MCAQVNESEILYGILLWRCKFLNGVGGGDCGLCSSCIWGCGGLGRGLESRRDGEANMVSTPHSTAVEQKEAAGLLTWKGKQGPRERNVVAQSLPGRGDREEMDQPRAPSITAGWRCLLNPHIPTMTRLP